MRPDKHPLLMLATIVIVVLSACRSSTPGSASADSAAPAPRADSAPGSGAVSTTERSDSVVLRTDKTQYKAGEQVTGAIFRLEKENTDFVGHLWQITATTHDDAYYAPPEAAQEQRYLEQHGGREPGQDVKAVDPIRNRGPRPGRNDPCPCGSGKKYKKCHGAAAAAS